jgi:hypothetical protein
LTAQKSRETEGIMPRYVILLHDLTPESTPLGSGRGTHWDLMFEWGETLRTWAVPRQPSPGKSDQAEQLADHRLAYLDYEGPVSGNRGHVTRWDQGSYEVLAELEHELRVRLRGARGLTGLVLQRPPTGDGHFWTVSFSAEPISG